MQEQLTQSHKFKLWKKTLIENGLDIQDIREVFTRYRYNGEALFSLVELDATTPEGDKIPPICFIKGEVVSVLVCLIDKDSGEKYLLLVRQRRICTGGYTYEMVAGMVDRDDDPLEVAIREVQEETGVSVTAEQVHPLNRDRLYASTGTSDEGLYFFYCELEMDKEEIAAYDAQERGAEYEHERIVTHLVPFQEAKQLMVNTNSLLNIFLYEEAVAKNY